MERLTLILFLSILITMVKTKSIASQDISIQSKCLVNQKKSNVQYYSTILQLAELFDLVILKQIQELV